VRRPGKAQGISCVTAHASPESPPPPGPVRLPRTWPPKGTIEAAAAGAVPPIRAQLAQGCGAGRARIIQEVNEERTYR